MQQRVRKSCRGGGICHDRLGEVTQAFVSCVFRGRQRERRGLPKSKARVSEVGWLLLLLQLLMLVLVLVLLLLLPN